MPDPYFLHRVVIAPFLQRPSSRSLEQTLSQVAVIGEDTFISFVAQQGLAPLWHQLLSQQNLQGQLSQRALDALATYRREAAAHYLLQKSALPEIRAVLDAQEIPHAVYKGVAVRERVYDHAELRPAADIDLLVCAADRDRAIASLVGAGYTLRPKAENASHEVNLQRGALTIDLHWDILRPGRTREPLVNALLTDRVDASDHWALRPAAALFVALVHPVFAKYATAPQSTLIRMLDLSRQLPGAEGTARSTLQLLDRGGVKTAAWIMLRWIQDLSAHGTSEVPSAVNTLQTQIAPGLFRRAYLSLWIKSNLPAALQSNPRLVQFAFTLLAHDELGDALTALRSIKRAGEQQALDVQALLSAAGADTTRSANSL